jgi:hypothetical protein
LLGSPVNLSSDFSPDLPKRNWFSLGKAYQKFSPGASGTNLIAGWPSLKQSATGLALRAHVISRQTVEPTIGAPLISLQAVTPPAYVSFGWCSMAPGTGIEFHRRRAAGRDSIENRFFDSQICKTP